MSDKAKKDLLRLLSMVGAISPDKLPPEYNTLIGEILNSKPQEANAYIVVLFLKLLKEIDTVKDALEKHRDRIDKLTKSNDEIIQLFENSKKSKKH